MKPLPKILLVISFIALLVFPFLFEAYFSKFLSTKYLDYYASIFMALITVSGVYYTIRQSSMQNKENIINSSLPVIIPNRYSVFAYEDLFKEINNPINNTEVTSEDYIEAKIERVYAIVKNCNPIYFSKIENTLSSKIRKGGYFWESDGRNSTMKKVYLLSLPIEFQNVGKGSAINVKCGINLKDTKDPKVINFQTVNHDKSFYLHIVTENPKLEDEGNFVISISYTDIYSNKYLYEYDFSIVKMPDGYHAYSFNFEKVNCFRSSA